MPPLETAKGGDGGPPGAAAGGGALWAGAGAYVKGAPMSLPLGGAPPLSLRVVAGGLLSRESSSRLSLASASCLLRAAGLM